MGRSSFGALYLPHPCARSSGPFHGDGYISAAAAAAVAAAPAAPTVRALGQGQRVTPPKPDVLMPRGAGALVGTRGPEGERSWEEFMGF